ncbi:hypothetical protein [Acidithiobacillus acidisediminis]|uniref:hypothetical protein n=1 Tax=Acidithiobacillus acidisediminis TaxID=2937799 RepID=UPI0020100C94|nr:hypothetical protein [Acidithiobacillus sp. S30A2]
MPHAKYNSYLKSVSNDRLQSQAVMPHVQDIPQALIWQSSEARGAELVWQTVPFSKPRILALVTRRHGHLQRDLYAGYHYRTYGASVRNTMIQRKLWASQDKL